MNSVGSSYTRGHVTCCCCCILHIASCRPVHVGRTASTWFLRSVFSNYSRTGVLGPGPATVIHIPARDCFLALFRDRRPLVCYLRVWNARRRYGTRLLLAAVFLSHRPTLPVRAALFYGLFTFRVGTHLPCSPVTFEHGRTYRYSVYRPLCSYSHISK